MEKSKSKKKNNIIISLFIILLIAIFAVLYLYKSSLDPVSSEENKNINLEIPEGSSSKSIAVLLEDKDLIKNKWTFLFKTKFSKDQTSLKAGNYDLNQGMTLDEIIASLKNGGRSGNVVKFTIPEGYEIKDIAEKLSQEGIIDKDKFLLLANDKKKFEEDFDFLKLIKDGQSLEGFLFPSTYLL